MGYRAFSDCPMRTICGIRKEQIEVLRICTERYDDGGEYQILLTDMEYHHRMKEKAERDDCAWYRKLQ